MHNISLGFKQHHMVDFVFSETNCILEGGGVQITIMIYPQGVPLDIFPWAALKTRRYVHYMKTFDIT